MLILETPDLLLCLGFIIIFLLLMSTQPLIFKENYSTIYEIIYYSDTQDISKTFAFRALVVISLSIIINYFTQNSFVVAMLSCTMGAVLQVWPALISYKIFSFRINLHKIKYLLGCLTYVFFCAALVFITYHLVIPLLSGEENVFYPIENDGAQIIITFISYAFIWKIAAKLSNSGTEKAFIDVDDFKQELSIWLRRMQMESIYIDLFQNEINKYSKKYKINRWLLKSVLQLEQLNRGSFLISAYEKILCYVFPAIAIKKDLSIGLAQLKISTAVQVLEKNPQSILKKLFDPEFNIRVCAKYLKTIEEEYVIIIPIINCDEIDIYKYIACRYLGFSTETNHKTVDLYAAIMRSYDGGELSIKIQEKYNL